MPRASFGLRAPAHLFACAATSLAIALSSAAGHASPQDLFGFGARSGAMGGAGPASAEGYEAVFGAPALLAETRTKMLTLGLGFAAHSLHADTPTQPQTVSMSPMQIATIGAALPVPFGGALAERITLGVGFLYPTKFLIRGQILYPEKYQFPIVGPRVQSLGVMLGGGVRIGDRIFLGAGFEALAALVGQITISVDSTGHVGSRSDDQVIAAYAPILSFAADLWDRLRVGVTYRGELAARFVVSIHAHDLGLPIPDFNVAGLAQYDPAQVAFELRWSSIGRTPVTTSSRAWRVVAGFIVRRWSGFKDVTEPTVVDNTSFVPPAIDARDTVSPRLGVERAEPLSSVVAVRMRGGYAYEPTPLPAQTKSFDLPADSTRSSAHPFERSSANLFDSNRHVFTVGMGVVLGAAATVQIDLFAQLHILTERTHVKDGDVATDAPGAPSVKTYGSILVAGATFGVRF